MAFNNNPTNQKKLVSTNGIGYYGKGPSGDKALNVRYLEQNLVVGIFNPLPQSQQTASSKFDYKSGVEIYLRGKTAKSLAKVVKAALRAEESNQEIEEAAISSGANLIEVADGTKYGLDGGLALAIYSNIDESRKPQHMDVFQFSTDKIICNYNKDSGDYETKMVDTDVDYFVDQLVEFAHASTGACAHIIRKEIAYDMNRIISRQLSMCSALGIKLEIPTASARPDWNQNSSYNGGKTSNVTAADLVKELEGLD